MRLGGSLHCADIMCMCNQSLRVVGVVGDVKKEEKKNVTSFEGYGGWIMDKVILEDS